MYKSGKMMVIAKVFDYLIK